MAPSGRPSRLPLRLRHLRIFFNLHSTAESPNHRIRTHRIFFKVLVLVQLLTKKLCAMLEMKSSLFRSATGGLTTESDYPYAAKKGECNRGKALEHAVKIAGAEMVDANSEAALERSVARQPVAVGIDASSDDNFNFYKGGVYSGPCGTNLDHAVTLVGYGADDKGRKYWIVRNSWGESWGEKGYIRMARGVAAREGTCGIAMHASYPVM